MDPSAFQAAKLAIVETVGLSKDALHIYVGLLVFLGTALVLRKPLRSPIPWLAVLAAALTGEVLDAVDDVRADRHWQWPNGLHDFANTVLWPTVLLLLARFTRLFEAARAEGR